MAQAVWSTLFWFGRDGSLTKAMPRPQEMGVDASRSLAVPKSTTLSDALRSASSAVEGLDDEGPDKPHDPSPLSSQSSFKASSRYESALESMPAHSRR